MLSAPPAIIVIPLASREQVQQTVEYVLRRLKQLSVAIKHEHSDAPVFISCRTTRDGLMERVDVYLATAGGDAAFVLPPREEIKEGFVERTGVVHLVQGVAVLFKYRWSEDVRLEGVEVLTVGQPYRDFKI